MSTRIPSFNKVEPITPRLIERDDHHKDGRERAAQRRLRPPAQRAALCSRLALLHSLEAARSGTLTLLVASSGYGKTTTLAQWWSRLDSDGISAAWYTASEADRDPVTFLEMITASLIAVGILPPGIGEQIRQSPLEARLDVMLSHLERVAEPFVLIIDDFDRAEQPAIKQIMEELIASWPDEAHLVVATRRKPSLALSLLRTQGLVRVVDASELRLTSDELAEVLALASDASELPVIVQRTEGWPVAVQLYRLWRQRVGREGEPHRFNGREDEVAEYLEEQIVSTLPTACQNLLIDLSFADAIEPLMADHVRNQADSLVLLSNIRAELPTLLQQIDNDSSSVYRLHPLLAEYAFSKLARSPAREGVLRARASDWLWRHRRYAAAIRYLNRVNERQILEAQLRELDYLPIFLSYGAGELRSILSEIPPEIANSSPRLQLMAALAQFKAGYHGQAYAWLQLIGKTTDGFRTDPGGANEQLEVEGRALAALFEGSVHGVTEEFDRHLTRVRELAVGRPLMGAWSESLTIVLHEMRGDLPAARQSEFSAREIFKTHGFTLPFAEQHLLTHSILIEMAEGGLRCASQLAGGALRNRLVHPSAEPIVTGMARIAQAAIDYIRHYNEGAADMVRYALDQFGEGDAWFDQYAIAWPVIADVAWRRGGYEAVEQVTDELHTRLASRGITSVEPLLTAIDVIYAVRGKRLTVAKDLASLLVSDRPNSPWRERDLILQALILLDLAMDMPDSALTRATRWAENARTSGRQGTSIKASILLAIAKEALGDCDGAASALRHAIGQAFAEEFVAPFAEEGAAIVGILQRVLTQDLQPMERRHGENVFRVLRSTPGFLPPNMLSEREAEIVAFLAEGASNKMIARRLGLTENTIKFHLRKVYAKLGVSSRKAATARALQDR